MKDNDNQQIQYNGKKNLGDWENSEITKFDYKKINLIQNNSFIINF